MLLDEPQKQKQKLVVTGNNRLLRGSIFALITLVWFLFVFSFIDMNWARFTPVAPFSDAKSKDGYIFYFICFSFFISSLIFSFIFYKKNMQPTDLLMRFAAIIMFFIVIFLFFSVIWYSLYQHGEMFIGGLSFIKTPGFVFDALNVFITYLLFYLLFYAIILVFGTVFFNGNFGTGGFILCFFIAAIFHVSLYLIMDLEPKLQHTRFPVMDFIMTLFFTLSTFGIGVISGDEVKPRKKLRSVSALENLHRY